MHTKNRGTSSPNHRSVSSDRAPRFAALWVSMALLLATSGLIAPHASTDADSAQVAALVAGDEGDPLDETLEYLWELLKDILGV